MTSFSIVVAMDERRGIGHEGRLPWQLSADLKHFKEITTKTKDPSKQNIVVMGRKTWESLPVKFRPLPNRINVVLTQQLNYSLPSGVYQFNGFETFLKWLQEKEIKQRYEGCFIIGGQKIFDEAIGWPSCQTLFVTHIQKTFPSDTFFPSFEKEFVLIKQSPLEKEGEISFFFAEYHRKKV
jgi:dihydrofolate reductase/thymidylate synthase